MRLAEFKLRLFLFFAGRLLKWAAGIEQEIEHGPASSAAAVDPGSAVLMAESSRLSGAAVNSDAPPEHWRRLVWKGPPEPWLDLLREKAPHLLSSLVNEPAVTQTEKQLADAEADDLGDPGDIEQQSDGRWSGAKSAGNENVETSQSWPIVSKSKRSEPTEYLGKALAKTWLDRLRFAASPPPPAEAKLEYIPEGRRNESNAADYYAEGGRRAGEGPQPSFTDPRLRSNEGRDQTTTTPDQLTALRKSLPKPAHHFNEEKSRSDRGKVRPPDYLEANTPEGPVSPESFRSPSLRRSSTEQNFRRATVERRRAAASEPALEWTRTKSARDRLSDSDYASAKTGTNAAGSILTFVNRSLGVTTEKREHTDLSSPDSRGVRVNEPHHSTRAVAERKATTRPLQTLRRRVDDRTNYPQPDPTSDNSSVRQPPFATNHYQARTGDTAASAEQYQFASTDLELDAAGGPVRNVWPTMPPAPTFEIADELIARESEAEDLRRLEQEQRGTAWNA